jgi:selenocysteine-specific translation elongation factor
MPNLNVAVPGKPESSRYLGKRGTASDITFYNLKRGETTVTFVEPTRYPERLAPLFYVLSMARRAILLVEKIDQLFGEMVLALDCMGIHDGYVVLRNYITEDMIAPLVRSTVVEKYSVIDDSPIEIRERLLEDADAVVHEEDVSGTLPVDHFFNVRGVGTVVLGNVAEGTIRKHDILRVLPGDKNAQIRSIQKHDEDFESASSGERAGLALKGIEVSELDRGTVLTTNDAVKTSTGLRSRAEIVKYWRSPLKQGMVLHLGHWMQYIPARIESSSDDPRSPALNLSLEKPLVHLPGDRALMTYPEGGRLRIVGTIELP